MVRLSVDENKNLLILICEGYIPTDEALNSMMLFEKEIRKLKPGLSVISNISNLNSSTRQARIILQTAMRKIELLSPKSIIRVIGNYNGALIFDRAEVTAKINYKVHRVNNQKEAMSLIE